ncbi:MAG: tRNA (adenosine(37)-N6)-dimethylallyltransferase MiaA [Planctomycetes bacterium]|nr:tRNA (adenosine(37)-N6)-dimethylallyltransferase MiaA [Planctomycetota bacterium]
MYILLGPTASGKSSVAFNLAQELNAEIISIDSMKIYRGMDIGTAKPSVEQRQQVRYHLIDIVNPWEPYNTSMFLKDCDDAIAGIKSRGKIPLLVAGTPLYLKVVLHGMFSGPGSDESVRKSLESVAAEKGSDYLHRELQAVDPVKAGQLHPNDAKRIIRALEVYTITGKPISSLQTQFNKQSLRYDAKVTGLRRAKTDLHNRINVRVDQMFAKGLVKEVAKLVDSKDGLSREAAQAVGYKEVISHLKGEITLDAAKELVKTNTHQLAKHQMTWFTERSLGVPIKWVDIKGDDSAADISRRVLGHFTATDIHR